MDGLIDVMDSILGQISQYVMYYFDDLKKVVEEGKNEEAGKIKGAACLYEAGELGGRDPTQL